MERFRQPLLLLWLTVVGAAVNILLNIAEAVEEDTLIMTNKSLKVIPHCDNTSAVTKLVLEDNLITLSKVDQLALASYSALVELHLDGNLVTALPANYFSVVPNLRVLSLSRNNINSLDPKTFFNLSVLTKLDLSHNLLTNLPPALFKELNYLQVLKLQENPWNCSCPLLISIQEVKEANVIIGGPEVICASPEKQVGHDLLSVTAVCYPSPLHTFTTDPQKLPAPANSRQSWGSSTVLKTTLLPSQNHSISKDQTPVLGNTWKFTVCVGALALATSMLIVFAIKGPSWYKLYHNYRHRRLAQNRDEEKDVVSAGISGRYLTHQTFTFKHNGQIQEGEDVDEYFEDPYIKREEVHAGEENLPEP